MSDANSVLQKKFSDKIIEIIIIVVGIIAAVCGFLLGLTDNPPGIALVLIGFFLVLFIILSQFGKHRNLSLSLRLLYWAPRTLCIITILFLSMFALDVFDEKTSIWNIMLALIMHLVPSFIMIGILILTWKWEWIGGILFNFLGLFYIISFFGRFPFSTYLLIAGPLFIVGILFLLNWILKKKYFTMEKSEVIQQH